MPEPPNKTLAAAPHRSPVPNLAHNPSRHVPIRPDADPIAEQRTASEVAGNAAGQDVDAPADAKGGEEGGSGHDPMAGAAVMHVHQEKHGYNILTPATECVGVGLCSTVQGGRQCRVWGRWMSWRGDAGRRDGAVQIKTSCENADLCSTFTAPATRGHRGAGRWHVCRVSFLAMFLHSPWSPSLPALAPPDLMQRG